MVRSLRYRSKRLIMVLVLLLLTFTTVLVSPVAPQSTDNFGVGSGHGVEVGINLPVLEQIRAEIAAGAYARPCTAEEHDPNRWHSLVNTEAGCHYNHQHGDDPNYVNDIFGEPGAWFQSPGQSISYPWQTFPAQSQNESNAAYIGTGQMENEAKHEGYYWVVRRDQPCNTPDGQYCVKDFRVQFHGMMVGMGAATRWHSMSAEVRVCRDVNDLSTCGFIRTGGWMDFGRLFVSNNAFCGHDAGDGLQHIPLTVDNQYRPLQSNSNPLDEERCHPLLSEQMLAGGARTGSLGSGPRAEWWAHGASDFRFQLQVADPIGNVYETEPGSGQIENHLFCDAQAPECDWNQTITTMRLHYTVPVNSHYISGYYEGNSANLRLEDGRYIDRFGSINSSCNTVGLDCIPIEYSNLQLNVVPGQGQARFTHSHCASCDKVDYDISPSGQQWITWFYEKFAGYTPEVPVPTAEPEPTAEPTQEPEPQPETPTGPAAYFEVDDQTEGQMNVNFRLIGVDDVYGVETTCSVNPQVLAGTTLVQGDGFNDSNSFIIDDGYQPDGTWHVAATRLQPNPAISGDSLAFTFPYNVLVAGDGQLACEVLVVDGDGKPISLDVVNGTIQIVEPGQPTEEPEVPAEPEQTPEPVPPTPMTEEPPVVLTGAISGTATYQNRPDNAGITVKLTGPGDMEFMEEVTGPDGTFTFTDVAVGDYTVQFLAPQHIPVVSNVTIESADSTAQVDGLLQAGDIDNNGIIDMVDVTLVGANFGIEVIPEIEQVDLNADGLINVSDLTLVGGNLDLVSPLATP